MSVKENDFNKYEKQLRELGILKEGERFSSLFKSMVNMDKKGARNILLGGYTGYLLSKKSYYFIGITNENRCLLFVESKATFKGRDIEFIDSIDSGNFIRADEKKTRFFASVVIHGDTHNGKSYLKLDHFGKSDAIKIVTILNQTLVTDKASPPINIETKKSNKGYDVFLAHKYGGVDQKRAEIVLDILKKQNLKVWIDIEQLKTGSVIDEEIDEGLKNSNNYIILLTKESISPDADGVKKEFNLAERAFNPRAGGPGYDAMLAIVYDNLEFADFKDLPAKFYGRFKDQIMSIVRPEEENKKHIEGVLKNEIMPALYQN